MRLLDELDFCPQVYIQTREGFSSLANLWRASTRAHLEVNWDNHLIMVQYFLSPLRTFWTEFNLDDGGTNYSNRLNFIIDTKTGPFGCQIYGDFGTVSHKLHNEISTWTWNEYFKRSTTWILHFYLDRWTRDEHLVHMFLAPYTSIMNPTRSSLRWAVGLH